MVGLRWWNQIDEDGKSHWIFEARKVPSNTCQARTGKTAMESSHGFLLSFVGSDPRRTQSPLLLALRSESHVAEARVT